MKKVELRKRRWRRTEFEQRDNKKIKLRKGQWRRKEIEERKNEENWRKGQWRRREIGERNNKEERKLNKGTMKKKEKWRKEQ